MIAFRISPGYLPSHPAPAPFNFSPNRALNVSGCIAYYPFNMGQSPENNSVTQLYGMRAAELLQNLQQIDEKLDQVKLIISRPLKDDPLLTVKEVSEFLKCSDKTVRTLIDNGSLSAYEVGGQLRIYSSDIKASLIKRKPLKKADNQI